MHIQTRKNIASKENIKSNLINWISYLKIG